MGFFQRKLVKLVIRVVTFPKVTLAICAALLIASVVLALGHLNLSTDEDELLAPKLAFVQNYMDFSREFPENDSFIVLLEPMDYAHPPAAQRWIDLADRLTAGLGALKDVTRVDSHVPPEEMGAQGLMFDDWDSVREESQHAADLAQFGRVVGDPGSLESLGTGSIFGVGMTQRLMSALNQGKPEETAPLAEESMRTLAAAIESPRPFDQWQSGVEVASLSRGDPRAAIDPRIRGYNMIPNESKRSNPEAYKTEKMLVISIHTAKKYTSLKEVTEPLKQMRAVVAGVAPDFPEFKYPVVTGRAALQADQMETSSHDTRIAEICGLSLVFIVLFLFLRNLWMVVVAELCLGVGIGWTFGWATLMVGRLNLLSLVFVIALIGIGMDYLIQILMRYRYEKRRDDRPQAIWVRVFKFVSAPISTACCGAAAAFLVALLTNFHGAAELGLIAGGGLLLCLASGYTVLPALLTVFPARVGAVPGSRRHHTEERHERSSGLRLMPAVLWILAAAIGLGLALPPKFDPNLLRMQDETLASVQQVRKLQTWSAVVTSPDLKKLRAARQALLAGNGPTTIDSTESLLDAYDKRQELIKLNGQKLNVNWHDPAPPSARDLEAIASAGESLAQKMSAPTSTTQGSKTSGVTGAARALTAALHDKAIPQAKKIERVAEWQRRFVKEVRANVEEFAPPPLDVAQLPPALREHLMSDLSPTPIYVLYIYPKKDLWDPAALQNFEQEVEQRLAEHKAATGSDVVLTGIAPQVYHSTEEIQNAFLHTTLYALIAVFVLMLLDLQNLLQTLLAISVLALGMPMLLLAMYAWRVWLHEPWDVPGAWNLANFFGLPILIGAGHEYGVFMVHRYRDALQDPRRTWRTWDVADRALLLCGIVTSASFGFLLFARHHGLQSLGWVMAVGTTCIYLSALLVLRPGLLWLLKRQEARMPRNAVAGASGVQCGKERKTPIVDIPTGAPSMSPGGN